MGGSRGFGGCPPSFGTAVSGPGRTLILRPMCGRFSLTGDLDFYAEYFGVDDVVADDLGARWNVAPTDPVYAVAEREGSRLLGVMRWGFVPHWAEDAKRIHINARAETAAASPLFGDSFARKRCLIPADGFYEWSSPEDGRRPHWIRRADGHPLALAGIWSSYRDPESDEWLRTCSILTTAAEGAVAPIHDRMPVALPSESWGAWLDRESTDPEAARALLGGIDSDLLMGHEVSKRVNSVRNDGPDLVEPAAEGTLF